MACIFSACLHAFYCYRSIQPQGTLGCIKRLMVYHHILFYLLETTHGEQMRRLCAISSFDESKRPLSYQSDMKFSQIMMLPFRILRPPLLDTPFATSKLASPILTVPIAFLSFGVIVGGAVACYVGHSPFYSRRWDRQNHEIQRWIYEDSLSSQCIAEGIVVSTIFVLGGLSGIAAFSSMTNDREGIIPAYIERFACTLPVWVILALEVFTVKVGGYSLAFGYS